MKRWALGPAAAGFALFFRGVRLHFFAAGEKVEARGVEPLSSSFSPKTSTRLFGA